MEVSEAGLCGLDSSDSGFFQASGFCEGCAESSCSGKCGHLLTHFNHYELSKRYCTFELVF